MCRLHFGAKTNKSIFHVQTVGVCSLVFLKLSGFVTPVSIDLSTVFTLSLLFMLLIYEC